MQVSCGVILKSRSVPSCAIRRAQTAVRFLKFSRLAVTLNRSDSLGRPTTTSRCRHDVPNSSRIHDWCFLAILAALVVFYSSNSVQRAIGTQASSDAV